LAVLAGDGLIVHAFETLARAETDGSRLARVTAAITQGVGARSGIVAGQAWESEPEANLSAYHHAKTAALFEAAVVAGALAGGGDAERWRELGKCFGRAYQLADDIADLLGDSAALGKPTGQDRAHGRPNALHDLGPEEAEAAFARTMRATLDAIPAGDHAAWLRTWVERALGRLLPKAMTAKLRQSEADLPSPDAHGDEASG
jgi:geranylgeranyl diphosphate synthase type II